MNGMWTPHADFADLSPTVGEVRATLRPELFDLVNLVSFGGAADRPTHVPAEVGRVGPVVLWESTGAADSLPFWNTNFHTDVYLYIVHGGVRVELKEPEGSVVYGEYIARTGDLFRLPKDVAHRTFSLDGKRRITLEILGSDPAWSTMGRHADVTAAATPAVGTFHFDVRDEIAVVIGGDRRIETPADAFVRGLRALVAWELHLAHNEFDGGFVVHDHGDRVTLKAGPHAEECDPGEVIAAFKAVLDRVG